MNQAGQYILAIIVLVFFSGLFSAIETAYSVANKIRLKNMYSDGEEKAGEVLKVLENFDRFLVTALIGNNVVNIITATVGTLLFTMWVGTNGPTVSTAVITVLVLVFGEITPKSLAKQFPEKVAMYTVGFVKFVQVLLTPITWLMLGWQWIVSKVIHIEEDDSDIADELITMVDEAEKDGDLEEHESDLISAAIEFNDLEVMDVFTPRVDIIAVDVNDPIEKIEEVYRMNSYSRLPVYESSIDHIIGVIHEKDFYELIYRNQTSLRKIVKPVVYTSPNTKISQLLKKLQTNKTHMAVVLDEFGGTDGIITVEDIIEELVGEIWDEHDIVEEFYTKINDTTYLIKGDAEVDDMFDRFDIEDDDEDEGYISVSGWVIYRLGHIPEVGESFDYKNLHVTVTEADQRTVLQVKVRIQETETDKEDE